MRLISTGVFGWFIRTNLFVYGILMFYFTLFQSHYLVISVSLGVFLLFPI
jgi:hypothetical protein